MPLSSIQIPGSEGRTQRTDWTLFRLRHHIISVCACVCAGKRGIHRDIASLDASGGFGGFESGKENMRNKTKHTHTKKKKKKHKGDGGTEDPSLLTSQSRVPSHRRHVCVCLCDGGGGGGMGGAAGLSSPQESSSLAEVSTHAGLRGDRRTPNAWSSVCVCVVCARVHVCEKTTCTYCMSICSLYSCVQSVLVSNTKTQRIYSTPQTPVCRWMNDKARATVNIIKINNIN